MNDCFQNKSNEVIDVFLQRLFRKYIAVPVDAYVKNKVFYTVDGIEIGEYTFPDFALVQKVVNDPCMGMTGLQYKTPGAPGLGICHRNNSEM